MTQMIRHARDKLIPWYFVAFFVGLAAVDGVMVWLAVGTQTGVVTEHAYEQGLAYNEVVAAEQAQEALGWKAVIKMEGTQLTVTLTDRTGQVLKPDSLRAEFTRPTQAGMDFSHELQSDAATTIDFPAEGLWEVRIFAVKDGQKFQHARRVVVQ